jgi:hypothetical protein
MIQKITTPTVTYYEYKDYRFTLFAFSLPDLFRDLEAVHGINTEFFKLTLN